MDLSLIEEQFSLSLPGFLGYVDVGPRVGLALDLAAVISVMLAALTFLWNQRIQRRAADRQHERDLTLSRRQHTLALVSLMNQEGPVFRGQQELALWIRDDRILDHDDVPDEDDRRIIAVLDFYDFLSLLLNQSTEARARDGATRRSAGPDHDAAMRDWRVIDADIVVSLLGGRMKATWRMLEGYVRARRDRLGRPQLYAPFEGAYVAHLRDRDDL